MAAMADPIPFSGSPLDRLDFRRRDEEWLQTRLVDDGSKILPVWKLNPLVRSGDEPRLAWATPAILDEIDSDLTAQLSRVQKMRSESQLLSLAELDD